MFKHLNLFDWAIVGLYLIVAVAMCVYHSRKASRSVNEFFGAGRSVSWWVLGTSMVATTFAADTPLVVSAFVVKYGIARNWYWWCLIFASLAGVFFFSRLWRRSAVLTDVELVELRYDGKPAALLRGFRAIYFSVIYNCIVIGWVNLAMVKILQYTLDIDPEHALWACFAFSVIYTLLSGLTGVMATDVLQFFIAMFGAVYLAVASVAKVGGMDQILAKMDSIYGAEKAREMTEFFPSVDSSMFVPVMVFLCLKWWGSYNIDGGAYLAQRMLSAKDERHAFWGMLWFTFAFYCLRPWPWIVVGLAAAVMFPYVPDAAGVMPDAEAGYIKVMLECLPHGLLGLMLVSFFAAYMSTIDTHLNWGASYVVNDLYKRFAVKEASEKHYMTISRIATVVIAFLGAYCTLHMDSIENAWYYTVSIYSGVAVINALRWYWWRINAWSEIAALATALASTYYFRVYTKTELTDSLMYVIPLTVCVSLVVTYLTPAVNIEQLKKFYEKVRPGGLLWLPVSRQIPELEKVEGPGNQVLPYFITVISVFSLLFGIGHCIMTNYAIGVALLGIFLVSLFVLKKWVLNLVVVN